MSLTTVQPGMLGTPQPYNFKNRIINGAMVINQRAGSPYTVNSASNYTLDRYEGALTGSGTFTVTQSTNVPSASTFQYSALVTVASTASSYSANDYYFLQQKIEGFNMWDLGWGTANAASVTVSFWVKASIAGTYAYHILNGSANYSYVATYTVTNANTWQFISFTVPGPTSGTWAGATNGVGIYTGWDLGSGSSKQTTANTWTSGSSFYCGTSGSVQLMSTSGATLAVTGHQFEVGVSATSFDYRPYGLELMLCQRYYEVVDYGSGGAMTTGQAISSSRALANLFWTVVKRAAPTSITYTGVIQVWNAPASSFTPASITFASTSVNSTRIDCQSVATSPLVAGNAAMIYPQNEVYLQVSAEL